jgi:hypothetical protein
MQSKPKSNSVVTHKWELGKLVVNVLGAGKVVFDPSLASEENNEAARRHGWTQRIGDAAAKSKDPKTGKPASPAVKFEAVQTIVSYYEGGDVPWKMTGGGGGDGGLLVAAVMRLKGKTEEQVREYFESRTPEQMKKIRLQANVVEEMNKIRLERVAHLQDEVGDALDDWDDAEDEGAEDETDE